MSDFVNYNKRDVGLTAHCKDLNDVLRRIVHRDANPRLEDFEVARDEVLTGTVSDVAVHIQAFCKVRGQFSELHITEPDDQITVLFNRTAYTEMVASISIPPASPHQQAIRSFLKSRRFVWPVHSEFPKPIYPAIPVQIFREISPLPTEPDELSRLTFDFFLHVGLESQSSLLYRHWMIARKG
jgi:hypothetical protein